MTVAVEVGSFTKNSATGTQDVPIATDLTGAAAGTWAIMFWFAISADLPNQATGVWGGRHVTGLGFTTGAGNSTSS